MISMLHEIYGGMHAICKGLGILSKERVHYCKREVRSGTK
jgi:hypothetical protein